MGLSWVISALHGPGPSASSWWVEAWRVLMPPHNSAAVLEDGWKADAAGIVNWSTWVWPQQHGSIKGGPAFWVVIHGSGGVGWKLLAS